MLAMLPLSNKLQLPPFPTRRSSDLVSGNPPTMTTTEHSVVSRDADPRTIHLDQVYDALTKGGWTVVRRWDGGGQAATRSEEHTSELQSQSKLVCRLLLEKKEYSHCL